MVLIDDVEMRRTKPEPAVSSFDDCKIIADTPEVIDRSSVVFKTSTGVRISPQLNEQSLEGIIVSNGSKSDPSDAMPAKDEVTGDESVTLCDGVNKEILESESFKAENLEILIKEEPDLHVENRVSDQEEDLMIVDSIVKSVIETVSRGSYNECVNVEVKEEPDLGTMLEEESLQNKYVSVFSDVLGTKDEEKMETEQYIPTGVILAPKPLQVFQVKPEYLDTPEVIEVETDSLNPLVKQEKSDNHEQISAQVKMEPVEETKVGALSLSLQVKEQKPVYVKKAHTQVDARKVKVEDGDFPVEKDWYLVGRSLVTATSTSKGRKLEDNEVVNFTFPSTVNWKVPNIVRFSTKRCGEVSYLLQRDF